MLNNLTIPEKIKLVEDYIYHRKGERVKIRLEGVRDIMKLNIAADYAFKWFMDHRVS